MKHIEQTITDLEFLIGELQRSAATLRNLATNGGLPEPRGVPFPFTADDYKAPAAPAAAAPKAKRTYKRPGSAPTEPARPLRRGKGGGIGEAVREVLPQFGDAWFSVDSVKDAVREKFPGKFDNDKIADVAVRLIGGVNRWLESQGTGRDRRYRNLAGAVTTTESYEERKAKLLK